MGSIDRLIESLTYRDLAGRRRPRRYTLASAAIFLLIGAIVVWGWRQRGRLSGMEASVPAPANTAEMQEIISAAPTAAGAIPAAQRPRMATPQAAAPSSAFEALPMPTPGACPQEPAAWELVAIAENDHFKRIAPPCVYEGLARTVAWELLRVMGYSGREAAELAGFDGFPWRPVAEITGLTNTQGPMTIEMEYTGDAGKQQLNHPDYRTWIIDRDGIAGLTFTLRGCYRTETVQGDQVESWGLAYPVVCVLSVDQMGWAVLELNSHHYTVELGRLRQFAMYGYAGNGLWAAIGYQKEPVVEILPPGASGPGALPLAMEWEKVLQDRSLIAGLHGLSPWGAAWLEETFGLSMRPLPENWPYFNDPVELELIQEAVDLGLESGEAP